MRERALERDDNPTSPPEDLCGGLFRFLEHDSRHHDDDDQHRPPHPARRPTCACATPAGRASSSNRSSAAGSGATRGWAPARASSTSTRRPSSGCRSSATSPTTTSARLEPTVPLPERRPRLPGEPRVVCDTLVRFDHGAGVAEVLAGDAEEIAGRLEAGIAWRREPRGTAGADPPLARPRPLHRDGRVREGAHRRRRRLPVRAVAAGRAADVGHAARHLPGAPARQPVAVPVPARARRDRARRLLARSGSSPARTAAPASARSPARPSRPRATSSGSSRRRRTAPST